MGLPEKTIDNVRYARLASRGCLTRLALFFNAEPEKLFRGDEVAGILITAVESIGSPEELPEEFAEHLRQLDAANTANQSNHHA